MKKFNIYVILFIPILLCSCGETNELKFESGSITSMGSTTWVTCPSGYTLLGGGCSCDYSLITGAINSENKFGCTCDSNSALSEDSSTGENTYAICASTGARVTAVNETITTAQTMYTVMCNAGTYLIGGAVTCGGSTAEVLASYPVNTSSWAAVCYELGSETTATITALCADEDDTLLQLAPNNNTTVLSSTSLTHAYISCNEGTTKIGGGCSCSGGNGIKNSYPINNDYPAGGWICDCGNISTTATAYVICSN